MTEPPLVEVEPGHMMSCHIPLEELRRLQSRSTDADAPVLTTPAGEDSGEVRAADAVVAAVADRCRRQPLDRSADDTRSWTAGADPLPKADVRVPERDVGLFHAVQSAS